MARRPTADQELAEWRRRGALTRSPNVQVTVDGADLVGRDGAARTAVIRTAMISAGFRIDGAGRPSTPWNRVQLRGGGVLLSQWWPGEPVGDAGSNPTEPARRAAKPSGDERKEPLKSKGPTKEHFPDYGYGGPGRRNPDGEDAKRKAEKYYAETLKRERDR